jgi:hypothetical protein
MVTFLGELLPCFAVKIVLWQQKQGKYIDEKYHSQEAPFDNLTLPWNIPFFHWKI